MANLWRKMKMNHQICQRVNLKIQAIFPGTLQNITQENVQTSLAVNKTLSSWTTISQPLVTSPIPCISSCLLSVTFIHSLLTKPTTNSHLYYTVKSCILYSCTTKIKITYSQFITIWLVCDISYNWHDDLNSVTLLCS
jgi:hypothetical protein